MLQAVGNAGPPAGPDRRVTLITGDQVRVSAGLDRVYPIPGPGRRQVSFKTQRLGSHLYVVPLDALTLLGRGRLDWRLFDVSELLSAGYDDAQRKDLPVIVTHGRTPAAAGGVLREAGATAQRELPAVNGMAAHVPKAELSELFASLTATDRSADGVAKVWLDRRFKPTLDRSVPQIGAPAAWAAGYTGRGVKVAVLDGGVDAAHPDFAGRLRSENFTPDGPGDANGHATHVASIVAGSGAASDGRYRGVAPDAEVLSGKVCVAEGCAESWILAGMSWAVEQQAKIINISLGSSDGPEEDPLEQAINTLTAQSGALFVVAAGNSGPRGGSIESPGSAAAALTVGAVDRDDKLADFSSRGPTVADGPPKPDLTAPGVGIVAAKSADSQIGEPVGTSYLRLSGTSMATPHLAGAAALLAQQHPDWTAGQLKAALMGSAVPAAGVPVMEQGSGRVDAAAASRLPVTADAGVLAFDLQRWPHIDDVAQSKELVYSNDGPRDVVLDLSATFAGPDGAAAPAGAVRLSASTITVPARGTAKVTATSDTNHDGPDGRYAGRLIAKAGATTLTTTLSVVKEEESYDLTIRHLDQTGAVTADYLDIVVNRNATVDDGFPLYVHEEDGTTNLRLPKGQYLLDSTIGTQRGAAMASNLVQPRLDLTTDQTVVVDTRAAKPVTVSVPDATAHNVFSEVQYQLTTPAYDWSSGIVTFSGQTSSIRTAQLGPSVPKFSSMVTSQWARPDPDGGELFDNTPYIFALAWQRSDGYYTGFSKSVRQAELATIKPTIAAHGDGTVGRWGIRAASATIPGGWGWNYPYTRLPATPAVYVTTDEVSWAGDVILYNPELEEAVFLNTTLATYRPGRTYRETWAQAVLGPSFPRGRYDAPWVSRTGNVLELYPPQSDGAGHYGQGVTGTGSLTVYRDGSKLGTRPYPFIDPDDSLLDVPAGHGRYRIDVETTGTGVSDVSTAVQASWTFNSTTPPGTSTTALPLWALRFRPALDDHNVLRTGPTHLLPILAEPQHGSAVGRLTGLTIQTSTDDGKTWRATPVQPTGANKFAAVVTVPDGASHISIKAQAADSKGNTVNETITRAYKVTR